MAIELENMSFSYPGGFLANDNITLKINDGERVAIVGKNGAGKTTVVKAMNALNKPTGGRVLVNGVDTKDRTTAQIAQYVGYVFQNPDDQIFNNSVQEELCYMPKYLKLPEDEIARRLNRAVALTDIGRYLEMNPYDIPYPIRKFVTIAAILCTQPDYLILDEPTAGQDRHGIQILENLMAELAKEGKSVITITHDMEFVACNFERVVVMANAHVIADGTAKDIFWNSAVLAEAGIKKPALGELAETLGLDGILYTDELIAAIR